jgi:hypothetical protein
VFRGAKIKKDRTDQRSPRCLDHSDPSVSFEARLLYWQVECQTIRAAARIISVDNSGADICHSDESINLLPFFVIKYY